MRQRLPTNRCPEFCGSPERHEDQHYLAVDDIDHTRAKTKRRQTNRICEGFHRTVLDESYRVAFRKKVCRTIEELQADLDGWAADYNSTPERPQDHGADALVPVASLERSLCPRP